MNTLHKMMIIGMVSVFPLQVLAADTAGTADNTKTSASDTGPKGHAFGHMYDEYWKRVDPEGKGYITKEAYLGEAERRFKEIDANGDGKITKDEMNAYHDKLRQKMHANFQQMQQNKNMSTPAKP